MDDPRWLRLVTVGLVLAALAVGYFLLTGRLTSNTKTASQVSKASPSITPSASPSATQRPSPAPAAVVASPSPTPTSAYNIIVNRTKGGQPTQALPSTGFPTGLIAILSVSAVVAGWGLRQFPN